MAVEGLVYWGTVEAASDQTMATVTRDANSEFREALEDLISVIAAGIISSDPTIVAAAEAAVADALAAQRIVKSHIVAATGGTWTDLDLVDATLPVALDVRNTALNRPVTAALPLTGWHIPTGASNSMQLLVAVSVTPQQWMRTKTSGAWSAWLRVTDANVLDARVSGLITELALTTDAELNARVAGLINELDLVNSHIVAPTGGTWTDLNAVDATLPVALDVRPGALNRPVEVTCVGWHIPAASFAMQVLTTVVAPPQQWMRVKGDGVWAAWVRVTDANVLNSRIAGLVNELDLVTLVKCVHLEGGVWVWDGPDAPEATHYVLFDHTGVPVVRSTPFPTPSAVSPALEW